MNLSVTQKPVTQEPQRLAENQKALLEATPEMVLLVAKDGSIEYCNASASAFFFNSAKKTDRFHLQQAIQPAITIALEGKKLQQRGCLIDNQIYDYHIAPFSGYNGDRLFWFLLKPVEITDNCIERREITSGSFSNIIGSSPEITLLKETVSQHFCPKQSRNIN